MSVLMSRRMIALAAVAVTLTAGAVAVGAPATAKTPASAVSGSSAPHNPLLKEQFSGEDDDKGQDPATISALCQNDIGKPNPYRRTGPNVDQITGDAIVGAGSQTGCSTAQNETTIAVNPRNPRNLVAGTNDYRVFNTREDRNDSSGWAYTSFDGGSTWRNIQLPHLTVQTGATGALSAMDSAGDPIVAFGADNVVYYGNIVFSRGVPADGGTEAPSGIVVNVSRDGGLHWSEPRIIELDGVDSSGNFTPTTVFNDKIWMAADKHSGQVYVTWTRFEDTPTGDYLESPIVLSSSNDFGRTFSPERRIDVASNPPTPGLVPFSSGSNPQVGRDGTLYVAYESSTCASLACDQPTDRDVTVVATSHDRGRTFHRAIVDTNYDFPFSEAAEDTALTDENFRINSFPQLAYDPKRDRLAVTWNDDRNGSYDATTGESIKTNGDNIVSTSGDGSQWSRTIAIGTPQDEVFGAIATFDGIVAVTSYTRTYDRHGIDLDYAYWSAGRNADLRQARIQRITTQSENPQGQFPAVDDDGNTIQGTFIGDYSAVAMGDDLTIHPCWTDFRGRPGVTAPNQDAYSQAIRLGRR